MSTNSSSRIRKVGIGLFLLFILFFALGLSKNALVVELKKVSLVELKKVPKSKAVNKKMELSEKLISDSLRKQNLLDSIYNIENQKYLHLKPGSTPIDTPDGVERVLLLGDSQLEGLRSPVSAYCAKNGHVLLSSLIYYGSSTKQWGTSDTLAYFLKLYKPSVVLFAIGLNELFVNDLDQRVLYIKKIIQTLESYHVRYFWIGPAAWTKDKGIIAKMRDEVGENFFASHELALERASDGRHPSKKAAKIWFDKVAISCTKKGILELSKQVDTLPILKFRRTILMNISDN
jgi:lysophospholipase L1-like esterase